MRIMQTVFADGERIQMLIEGELYPAGIAQTGDGRLVIARRRPKPTDWVNRVFVGDHEEPKDDTPHVHGEVAS